MCTNETEFIPQFKTIKTVQMEDINQLKIVFFFITNIRFYVVQNMQNKHQWKFSAAFKARFYNYIAKPPWLIGAVILS